MLSSICKLYKYYTNRKRVHAHLKSKNAINRIIDEDCPVFDCVSEQERIENLQRQLRQSDMRCVPHGTQQLTESVYPAVQAAFPDLCNDNYRCEDAHEGGKDQAEWKHAIRNVLNQLAEDNQSRVRRHDDHGVWMFTPRFKPGKQYRRKELHDKHGGMRQSGIAPSRKVPVVFIFTGDTGELYGYEDSFENDGTFLYTGEGQVGDMSYERGNKAIGEHQNDDRELHVFEKVANGLVTYLGQYVYKDETWKTLPDKNGNDRQAKQFELHPIEEVDVDTEVVLSDGNRNPKRMKTTTASPQRDEKLVREMKRLYDDTCQLCGDRRLQGDDIGYSNVHHIKPLGKEHSGPDISENVIVLCPNHHDDFDNGMLSVDPETLEISHHYEDKLIGETVIIKRGHNIGSKFLAYHNQTLLSGSEIM